MNLRFVFSLIVSLLSLLPAAAQDLTRNWIRERIFLDAEGKKCVTSVQYFDGIGRETLLLTDGLSPAGGVAGALTGESFAGRTSAKWLPATGLTGFDFLTPERVKSLAVSSHEGDSVPFSLTRRDALGRVSSVRNAGGDLAGKAQLSDYTVNRTYAPVKRYCVDASEKLASRGMWREGALRGVLTSDEDGISTEVFSDLRGRKVLERRNGNNDTYFVYDDAGRLSFVLTPGLQEDSNLLKHAYEYRYDRRSECVYSRIPGCEAVEMHRDTAGRTAVVRDGVLRKKGRSRFILYDRLGSVRSVADEDGNVLQQNLYYARGGAWGDVCTAPGFQSYKYCGKYLDRKHGLDLYDYGARLYDPAAAFWTSPDPLCEKYYNISPYAFCNNNPVTFIDPDGRFIDTAWDAANVAMGVTSFISNVTVGNIVGAALDGAGLIVDVAATAIPGIPGGAATAIKAVRGAKIAEKVVKNAAVKSAVRKGVKKVAANFKPYAHHRPKYAKGQVEEVWRRAMDKDGIVKDPYTNEILVWDGKSPRNWDMGHIRGKEYKDLHKDYMDGKISKEEFLREYRNPDNYIPQSRYSNRSHKFEAP